MINEDYDIGVLDRPAGLQASSHTVRPDAPVLPTLASQCPCELAVNEQGMAMVIFTKMLPEGIEWAEYDADLATLTFVTWSGQIMGLGMKIHLPFRKYLKMGKEIFMVQMTEDGQEIVVMYPADLVVRHIGV